MRALAIRQAEAENEEVRSWTCATCDTMVETEGEHCRACAAYWSDVRSGMFDDADDLFASWDEIE